MPCNNSWRKCERFKDCDVSCEEISLFIKFPLSKQSARTLHAGGSKTAAQVAEAAAATSKSAAVQRRVLVNAPCTGS